MCPRESREVDGWPTERVRQPISSTRVRDPQRAIEDRGPPRRLAGDVQGRVETVERNPPDGRRRAAGLYRMRPVSPTTSTLLYENASGLQLTPSKGAQVLTWTTCYELNLGWMTLALSRVRQNLRTKRANQNPPPQVSTAFLRIRQYSPRRSQKLLQRLGGYPRGVACAPPRKFDRKTKPPLERHRSNGDSGATVEGISKGYPH